MIVVCKKSARGVWGHVPQEDFEFTFSQIAIWDKISKQHFDDTYLCLATCNNSHTQFQDSWGRGGEKFQPLYETLFNVIIMHVHYKSFT